MTNNWCCLTSIFRYVLEGLHLVHEHARILKRYGLKQMDELSDKVAKDVAKHYFNVMAIRHPFDRLVAYYRDKMIDTDKYGDNLCNLKPNLVVNIIF